MVAGGHLGTLKEKRRLHCAFDREVRMADPSPLVALVTGGLGVFGALVTAAGAFTGIAYAQRKTARERRADEMRLLESRVATLRSAVRAELTQLIDVVAGEIDFAEKKAAWTWLPIRDYFDPFRRNQDILDSLDDDEIGLLTTTMHIFEERMGYIYRRALEASGDKNVADILPDLGAPIGRNIRLEFQSDDARADYQGNLRPILDAARPALEAFAKNIKTKLLQIDRPVKTPSQTARRYA
jgi:hypothetical protein